MASAKVPRPKTRKFLEDCESGDAVTIAMGDVIVSSWCNGGIIVILCDRTTWREVSRGVIVRPDERLLEVLRIGTEYYASLNAPPGIETDPLMGEKHDELELNLGGATPSTAAVPDDVAA